MDETTTRGEVAGPALWRGQELAQRDGWQTRWSAAEVDEIDAALRGVRDRPLESIRRQDFVLPTVGARLAAVQHDLEHGSGSAFLRGWPAARYGVEDNARVFWGLARHLGTPVSQSARGERIFPVQDAGLGADDARARGPNTRKGLHFHCDRCDVIGFQCIRQARSGGENYLVSSLAVHNEIRRRRPDLLEALYEPWYYKTHNVDTSKPDPWCRQPIFAVEDGHFVAYVLRVLIERASELPEIPDLTPRQRQALDFLDQVCADPELHYQLRQEPGDLLFVNNFVNFHSRSAFDDHPEPERKRLLHRIWLSMPNSRPLPSFFAGSFGATAAGALRGGIHPPRSAQLPE